MESYESQTSTLDNTPQNSSTPTRVRRRRPWMWLLLALLLLGGGFALWRMFASKSQPPAPATAQGPPPRPVETVALAQGNGVRRIMLLGQVEAGKRATVRTQTAGLVKQVLVQSGDRVTPGMTIAILDDADQQLAVAEAEASVAQERSELARLEVGTRSEIVAQRQAELRSAQAREQEAQDNLRRSSELVGSGALSRRTLVEARAAADEARGERLQTEASLAEAKAGPTREEIDAQRASVATAMAALNQARLTVQRTRITALSNGVVQEKNVSVGDFVQSGDPLVTMVDGNVLDVFLELPEQLSGSVTPGLPVSLTAPRALREWQTRATITGVVPSANAASRRQFVRVRLDRPPQSLLPGMAIQGELELRNDSPSLVVSRDALLRREDKWLVFTVAGNKAKQLEVNLVADMGKDVAIYSDQLRAGQAVVVRGGDALADGATVQATQRRASPQAGAGVKPAEEAGSNQK